VARPRPRRGPQSPKRQRRTARRVYYESHGGRVPLLLRLHTEEVAARKGENKTPGYDGYCRSRGLERGPKTAIRFKTPREGHTIVHDLIRGDVDFANDTIDDFVVAKSSGVVLYALANVTDDRDDRITHVIRGEEHLSNAPKQILLWTRSTSSRLTVALPDYAHLPLLVNEQRKKLSKRKDPVATESYRDQATSRSRLSITWRYSVGVRAGKRRSFRSRR